jgi:hypothetical protein
MSERVPPAIATWLIERLGPVHHRESLIGDLIEQYRRGRSERWYWRQVVIAVLLARLPSVRSVLAIPKAKVILRLLIECAILALGVGTLTWAATASKATCEIASAVCTQTP